MKQYTAWELAGDWFWVGTYNAVPVNGRAPYETLTASQSQKSVCGRRSVGLRQCARYFKPETRFKLVKIETPNRSE